MAKNVFMKWKKFFPSYIPLLLVIYYLFFFLSVLFVFVFIDVFCWICILLFGSFFVCCCCYYYRFAYVVVVCVIIVFCYFFFFFDWSFCDVILCCLVSNFQIFYRTLIREKRKHEWKWTFHDAVLLYLQFYYIWYFMLFFFLMIIIYCSHINNGDKNNDAYNLKFWRFFFFLISLAY